MAIRQTRIYAPATAPYDADHHWAETMMARIIKPLVDTRNTLSWFWFTRYASMQPEFGDSDGNRMPPGLFGNGPCRSLRFRFEIADDHLSEFEREGEELVKQEGCWIADWRDYGVEELCSNRFIGEDRTQARRDERLKLVKEYLGSVSRLALHALVPADQEGRFRFEHNDDSQNPNDSAFFSLHHLFCNTTDVILKVLVAFNGSSLVLGTHQYRPKMPVLEFPIRF